MVLGFALLSPTYKKLPQLHALPQPRGLRWSIDVDPVDLY
jgi:hypothetical protein